MKLLLACLVANAITCLVVGLMLYCQGQRVEKEKYSVSYNRLREGMRVSVHGGYIAERYGAIPGVITLLEKEGRVWFQPDNPEWVKSFGPWPVLATWIKPLYEDGK